MSKKVLIVDDEEEILNLIKEVFYGQKDYGILRARDGEEALRIVHEENPDIIVLDIQLPNLSGFEICKLIKSDSVTSHIKILMLSGMTQNSDLQKAQEAGADGYVTKPFNPIKLVEKVEELLTG